MFVPGMLLQPSLILLGEARSLTQSGAGEMCFTRVGYGLTCKHWTMLERLSRNKHSSLITDLKRFISFGPGPNDTKLFCS